MAVAAVALCAAASGAERAAAPHPRIWLDEPTLKALRARAKQGTAEWRALKRECDAYLKGSIQYPDGEAYPNAGVGEGYQGSGYFPAVLDLGLCYQAAPKNRARYGARGAEVLAKMSNAAHSPNPLRDAGYGIRFYGVTMSVGFDWLYPALSAELRRQVIAALGRWIGAYEEGGFEYEHPQGNYFAGYYAAKALAALATEGDDPGAAADWRDWLERVHGSFVRPYYAENLSGGGWPEGWNYGPLASLNMTWPIDAARTAKGLNLLEGYSYPLNNPRYLVAFTWPNLRSLEDSGTQRTSDDPAPTDPTLATAAAGLLARFGDPFAPAMHSYARAIRAAQPELRRRPEWGRWVDFLYWDPKGRERDFRRTALSYFARGMETVAVRSSWAKDAVWASYRGGPYTGYPGAGEQLFDEGSLTILNGAKQYLVYAPTALQRNTPGTEDGVRWESVVYDDNFSDTGTRGLYNVFYVSEPQPTGQGDWLRSQGARTSTTFDEQGTYAYLRTTNLEDLYPRIPGDRTIESWTRQVVYVRPGLFVVRDLTDVTDPALDQWLSWHFLGPPANVQVLLPAGHRERVVDVLDSHKVYRLEVRPGQPAGHNEWITVLQPRGGPAATLSGSTVRVGSMTVTFREDGTVGVTP